MKIRKILVSQPEPKTDKSPYFDLAKKYSLQIDFRPFIKVEGVSVKDFRQDRINIAEHTGVIFTSRTAVDHFFRICEEMRICVPDTMKYFCISESIAFYLQKYIVYRKRKIFYGKSKFEELMDLITKHKEDLFLLPLSDIHKQEIPEALEKQKIRFNKAILYRTVSSDLSDLKNIDYDVLVFFSPSGIKSLLQNFPEFAQDTTKIAAFGPSTSRAVKEAKLRLDIQAPRPNAPSMTMALDQFIKKHNKNGKE
ncbi:MAG: uroporphyrinogen-III synthase [Bacteroidales bacterium]|nr:uroporphyrinogen-III synthase [Bacteroidales bacterium]